MKKLSFFSKSIALGMFLFVALTACQKEEQSNQVDFATETPVAKTYEAKVIQQTTNVIVSMLNENPALFNDINEAIKSDAVEYMEDRILFADLFKNPQLVKSVDGQTQLSTFSTNFRKHASSTIQYAPAYGQEQSPTLDADALMQYLEDNNISIYCPFPLEDYAEDNRIPAIAANIGEEYVELPGIQFYADGSFDSVMVSQAYADLHPVWLINQEEEYIFEDLYTRLKSANTHQNAPIILPYPLPIGDPHYEVRFNSIFITDYFGTLAGADLKIYLCKSTAEPALNANGSYVNSFNFQQLYVIPRKNVRYAQEGLDDGWVYIGYIFDDDWKTTEDTHYFAAYEKDSDAKKTITADLGYNLNGVNVGVTMTLEYYKYSDLICITEMSRAGMNNLVSPSNTTYYVNDQDDVCYVAPDGYRLYSPSNTMFLSIAKTTYYVEE